LFSPPVQVSLNLLGSFLVGQHVERHSGRHVGVP
jgi:hypothetical protein